MDSPLSTFQESRVLSLFPDGATLLEASYFPSEYLPCPVRVTVERSDQTQVVVVVRLVRHQDASLSREAALLPILHDAGLPVPRVLLAPQHDPDTLNGQDFAVYSFLPGTNCQTMAEASAEGSQSAIAFVISAAETLAGLTEIVRVSAAHKLLPKISLLDELASVQEDENVWLQDSRVMRVIKRLSRELAKIDTPLVLSNGDYQPANFLVEGGQLTGYVDFEYACYQDFLYGFVKYPIYDLRPLNKAGIIAHLLEKHGATPTDFALRLAVGCLKTLKREIPADMGDSPYCQHIFRLLDEAMSQVDNSQ